MLSFLRSLRISNASASIAPHASISSQKPRAWQHALLAVTTTSILGFSLFPAGCSVVVGTQLLNANDPCDSVDDCLADFACIAGRCQAISAPATPPPFAPNTVGPAGGTVLAEDGARLIIPKNALDREERIELRFASETIVVRGVETPVSRVYQISPDLTFAVDVTIEVPIDTGDCGADARECSFFVQQNDEQENWEGSDDLSLTDDGFVSFTVSSSPIVVVGNDVK